MVSRSTLHIASSGLYDPRLFPDTKKREREEEEEEEEEDEEEKERNKPTEPILFSFTTPAP